MHLGIRTTLVTTFHYLFRASTGPWDTCSLSLCLQEMADELADCDPEELQSARTELLSAEANIQEKTKKIAELRSQLQETEMSIGRLSEQKQRCHDEIKEAERVREECRGWSSIEISSLKGMFLRLLSTSAQS